MNTFIWIIVIVVALGVVIYLFKDKLFKKEGDPKPPTSGPTM